MHCALNDGDPEGVATVIRLGLSHMAMTAKRLTDAMVLDRLDAELDQIDVSASSRFNCFS